MSAEDVLVLMRSQGFEPEMENIVDMPLGNYLRHDSWMRGPLRQVMCRFRSVRDAERAMELLERTLTPKAGAVFEYLPDSCE